MTEHYNIAVLGGGPGGYVAALKAGQAGAKVAVIEKEHLGGTCLNWGCIPSKALLASAELRHHLRHAAAMGIDVQGTIGVNWPVMQMRKDKIIQNLRGGIKGLLEARKVAIIRGHGRLDGPGRIVVTGSDGSSKQIGADKVIIATGSAPSRITGWPENPEFVCTSDEALHWSDLPRSLIIVGGGVIGCEFACMLEPLGVQVSIVEMLPQLLPNLDAQVARTLREVLEKRGIKVFTDTKIESLTLDGKTVKAALTNGQTLHADRALVATGRRPNTSDIGLSSVGIETARGFIPVNERMETSAKGYYCIGDANGRCLLAHAASAHGVVAAENAIGHARSFDAPVPNCVYTFPEVASVGLTQEEAQAKGHPIATGTFPLSYLGKAMAVNDTVGFVKVVKHRESGDLLGVHMIGHNATECIASATALLHQKASLSEVVEVVFAHPTISEAIKEAAEDSLSMALHLPPRKVVRLAAEA